MTDKTSPPIAPARRAGTADAEDVPFLADGIPWQRLGRFLRVLAIVFVLEGALLVSLNVVVNPRSEFPFDTFRPLIPNTHQIKIDLYEEYLDTDGPPEAVVLGTSRARRLDPASLEAQYGPTFNFAIEAAEIEDELAIWRWLVAQGDAPDRVLLLLDLDQLRGGQAISLRLATNPDLKPYTDVKAGLLDYAQWAAFYAAKPDYVADTFTVLWYTVAGYPASRVAYEADGGLAAKEPDTDRFINTTRGQQALRPFLEQYWRDYLGYEAPAAHKSRLFHQLLEEIRQEGASIDVILAPIQPDYLDTLRRRTPFDTMHDTTIRGLLQLCGDIRVFDFTYPDILGVDANQFVDGVHYQGDNVGLILAGLQDPSLDLCSQAG